MSSFTPTRFAAFGAVAAVATGALVTAPAASAAVTSISIQTAGSKPINQTTYAWGTVHGGAGITACTQVLLSSGWTTSQCATTTSSGSYAIPLTYGSSTAGTYTFRVAAGGKLSPNATLKRTGGSTPAPTSPSSTNYIKGRTPAGRTLQKDFNGVKVYLVQKALGVATGPLSSTMGTDTMNAVKSFQRKMRLPATGFVDANTFYAIKDYAPNKKVMAGYNFDVDAWKQSSTVSKSASHQTKVNAMIAWAKSKLNVQYIWGGTGPLGYDCSGFLLQALRAGGYDPKGVSNDTDIVPPSKLSRAMWNDGEFAKADLKHLQPGDFVYYSNADGVGHVSMYVGSVAGHSGPQVINAVGAKVQYTSASYTFGIYKLIGANRMP